MPIVTFQLNNNKMEFVSGLFEFLVYTFYPKYSKPVSALIMKIATKKYHVAVKESHLTIEVEIIMN